MADKIEISFNYDRRADILYITFGDDEPVYTDDMDGLIMLEIGWFSGLPKGLRIIGAKAHNLRSVKLNILARVEDQLKNIMEARAKAIQNQESSLQTLLDKELPRAFTAII